MSSNYFRVLFLLLLTLWSAEAVSHNLWPQPKLLVFGESRREINPLQFRFELLNDTLGNCDIVKDALDRYSKLLFSDNCELYQNGPSDYGYYYKYSDKDELEWKLSIGILDDTCPETVPTFTSTQQEAYNLELDDKQQTLSANTVWGLLRGLETFSQLMYMEESSSSVAIENAYKNQANVAYFINDTMIKDEPRYTFRGFLIDSARHYLSVATIKLQLDAMSYNKLNVLHWHLVDDQSFPYVSDRFPQLSRDGAFDERHVYTSDDIDTVIAYARFRGIRVIVELDTPGHTRSWRSGGKNLLTECYNVKTNTTDGTYGPIDPTVTSNYDLITELFREVTAIFRDSYFHLGGDEVDFRCWQSNPNINAFMAAQGMRSYEELESYYFRNLVDSIRPLNKRHIVWQEVFDNNVQLDNGTIIHVWKGGDNSDYYLSELDNVTSSKYYAILSSPWYLNYVHYGDDWESYYRVEPEGAKGQVTNPQYILGGEACVWGEWVDGNNLLSLSWVRGSAVAERLWSPKYVVDIEQATRRIDIQRCRMLNRKIPTEPATGPGFCRCDHLL